jgi:uncharacterized protein HemX
VINGKGLVVVMVIMMIAIVAVVALVAWAWVRTSARKEKIAALSVTGSDEYRSLSDEYRRLADMAVTAQEHTELKLGDMAVQMAQLRGQLESVQRILKDVE